MGEARIKCMIRLRPPELKGSSRDDMIQLDSDNAHRITINNPLSRGNQDAVTSEFDQIFDIGASQQEVYQATVQPLVEHVMNGNNACMFAYGQTGSGKTYSIFGERTNHGVTQRAVRDMFKYIKTISKEKDVGVVISFLEIYMDQVRDLGLAYLEDNANYMNQALEIHEDLNGQVYVKDLTQIPVTTADEVLAVITKGTSLRKKHETEMNPISSRSHTIVSITVTQKNRGEDDSTTISGILNLLDLAGSERVASTAERTRFDEAVNIKSSLTALGKVVIKFGMKAPQVPYRDSKLTRILQNSLGGNSWTTLLATMNPSQAYYDESVNTLLFASRCMFIDSKPRIAYLDFDNMTEEQQEARIRSLEAEVNEVKFQLDAASGITDTKIGHLLTAMGLHGLDFLKLLQSPESKEMERVQKHKEVLEEVEKLQAKNRHLDFQAEDQQSSLEEMKKQDTSRGERHTQNVIEMREGIKSFRDNIAISQAEGDANIVEQMQLRTEELQQMLTHSHYLLEEKQAIIDNLPFTMQSKSADVKNLADMRELGKEETVKKFEKMFAEQKKNHQIQLQSNKQSLEFQLNEKNEQIRELEGNLKQFNNRKDRHQAEQQQEVINMYDLSQKYNHLLRNIQNGVFSQARTVDFPESEIPDLPDSADFPITIELLDKNEYKFRPRTGKSTARTNRSFR